MSRLARLGPLAVLALSGSLSAQSAPTTAASTTEPIVTMRALLEKTIFKVDVLTLEVQLVGERASAIRRLADAQQYRRSLADSIARLAIPATRASATIEFRRNVSLGQFLDGIDDNLRRARDANIISPADYALVSTGLPRWFAFLADTGIRKGDRILYDIRGDTLRTRYETLMGTLALDQTDVGPERRLSVLGSYFAPKSDFRERLVKSLLSDARP